MSYHLMYISLLFPGSSSGSFSGPGFNLKSGASTKPAGRSGRPSAGQSKPWMAPSAAAPKAQPPKPAPQPAKPNYNLNFSVIGGREERGVRGPGFGETTNHITIRACLISDSLCVENPVSVISYPF